MLTSHKTQRHAPSKKKALISSQKSLPAPGVITAPQTSNGNAGGLLDFKNMTDDHVLEIANKADELIEIIKNIKKTVKGGESEEGRHEDALDLEHLSKNEGAEKEQKDPNSWW